MLAGRLAALSISPGSPLFEAGIEVLAVSASLEQSRVLLNFVRESLGERGQRDYRWLDSGQRLSVTHIPTGTKLRVLSSSARRAMGLAQFSTIFADEPGSWEARGGRLMFDALRQSLGKRQAQRLVLIGTRAPAEPGSWWPDLLESGSGPGRHVTILAAPDGDAVGFVADVIRRCNPMVNASRVVAGDDLCGSVMRRGSSDTLRRSFEAFRLNRMVDVVERSACARPTGGCGWRRRPVPPRAGRPIVGIDLGAERSWSRGVVSVAERPKRVLRAVPGHPRPSGAGTGRTRCRGACTGRLVADDGVLLVDEGLRVSPARRCCWRTSAGQGIVPAAIYCDRFMLGDPDRTR